MNKAENFIQDYTMNCSNENGGWNDGDYVQIYQPWLTPDQARKAVEIAREEVIEKVCNYIRERIDIPQKVDCSESGEPFAVSYIDYAEKRLEMANKIIEDLKQAIRNE